jgi:hypothetical protein
VTLQHCKIAMMRDVVDSEEHASTISQPALTNEVHEAFDHYQTHKLSMDNNETSCCQSRHRCGYRPANI